MKDEDNFYRNIEEDTWEEDEDSWKEKFKKDVSRIERFLEEELGKDTKTERNIRDYQLERDRREAEKEDDWMEELDHVTFGFLIIEVILVTYFLLALIGIVPMF